MNVLVINGSPKGEQSDCMKLTDAFLRGMGEKAEVIHAAMADVKHCLGCFGCWHRTPGRCVQKDDMEAILQKIISADLVIWSTPLYCYGFPSTVKAIIDRLLPLNTPELEVDEEGRTYHPNRGVNKTRFMLISGCGFPNITHNYEALLTQFAMLFGEGFPRILCAEAPLLSIAAGAPFVAEYIAAAESAGREFSRTGTISEETQRKLDTPMLAPDIYRAGANG